MRKYTLVTDDVHGWYTGLTDSDQQALMGFDYDAEICILFDQDGNMQSLIERFFDFDGELTDSPPEAVPYAVTQSGWQRVKERFQKWYQQVIVYDQPIHVREFEVERRFIRVEGLSVESLGPSEDPSKAKAFLDKWQGKGLFIFWWGEKYLMNADGTVSSF